LGGSFVFGISRRRRALAAALSAAALACGGTAAQAHPGQVVHLRVRGEMAQALFQRGATATVVDAESDNQFGPAVVFDRFTGSAEGGVDVSGAAFGDDVSVTVDKRLRWATVVATVPVVRCVLGGGEEGACSAAGTVRISLTFDGSGRDVHTVTNQHLREEGILVNDHLNALQRDATVGGTLGGATVRPSDLLSATIGNAKSGTMALCHAC
jgi:hypothetical protein